jgi:N utilization substance protein B
MEDKFENWIHDKSLVVGAIKKTIKALPATPNFYEDHLPDDETVKEFGEELLHKVLFFDEELLELVKPALKNWDLNRVAVIDLILIKMALCEMLYFPTIPVKVTINEFIDISKIYSTPKSKDFINGILDRLMKKLTEEGKIVKEGRGLID